ncbi:MAG: class I SAM-dependent methyltransferase [Bowdeniella nasicola]|nr:class I SAM-dependent methyltransferase [Bowdeniella nasicola]
MTSIPSLPDPHRSRRRDLRTRDERAQAFHAMGREYAAVRPGYPQQLVSELAHMCPSECHAVDIGAGTGIFTAALTDFCASVIAVEPAEAMGRSRLDFVRWVQACGEDTELPAGCADLVTYAQAWHWVDPKRAAIEAHRLLRGQGLLALVWNQLDVTQPWVHRLARIMRAGDVHSTTTPPALPHHLFTPPERIISTHAQYLTPAEIAALGRTRSSYVRASDSQKQRMAENLHWYVHDHLGYSETDVIELPYRCVAWVYRRAPIPRT